MCNVAKDFIGNIIRLDDEVAFPQYNEKYKTTYLRRGIVHEIYKLPNNDFYSLIVHSPKLVLTFPDKNDWLVDLVRVDCKSVMLIRGKQ